MMSRLLTIIAIGLCVFGNEVEPARILGVFPVPMFSHQIVFRRITLELAKRGHELVVFTTHPVNDPSLKNYTEIDMHHAHNFLFDVSKAQSDMGNFLAKLFVFGHEVSDDLLSTPEMQRLIAPDSNEHFDLILAEFLHFDSTYGLKKRFNAPLIGISTLGLVPSVHYDIGNPAAIAYSPGVLDAATNELDFWGRLNIAYRNARWLLMNYYMNVPRHDVILKKHFGSGMPYVGELSKDVDLLLVNTYTALAYPRPNLPLVIEIGGMAFQRELKGLPQELQVFLDGAVNGFIYFSLGSNVKSKELSPEKLDALLSAFAELPYKVLWKFELDTLPGKPDNVFIYEWLPQQDVLAHPNIRAFMYQGGLQSTEEAVNYGVPLIGIPLYNDQHFNVLKLQSLSVATMLEMGSLRKHDIISAVVEVVTNTSYKENMLRLSEVVKDQPYEPIQLASWWVEYILRHKGASHLKTRARHMPWYQRDLLDVLAFVITATLLIIFAIFGLLRHLVGNIMSPFDNTVREKIKRK